MQTDLSFIHLIGQAGPVVQLVMLLLLAASVASWVFIVQKIRLLRAARARAEDFEDRFWSGGNVRELHQSNQNGGTADGMARLFEAGYSEYSHQARAAKSPERIVEAVQRVMRVTLSREMDKLEEHLNFLATVGSTSPYVGLFGTVWGIMNAFRALADVKQATLAMVAPGIAEALIATAMGLFAAIPAVVAYNRFNGMVERLGGRYENFMEEFSTLIQRQVYSGG